MENLSAEVIEGKLTIEKNTRAEEIKREFKELGAGSNTLKIFFGYFVSVGGFLFVASYFEFAQDQIYISLAVLAVTFWIQVSVATEAIKTNKRIDLLSKIISNEYQKINS